MARPDWNQYDRNRPGYRCMICDHKRDDKGIRRCLRCKRVSMTQPTEVVPSPARPHGYANNRNGR